jgi:hypothetical protein
MMREREKGWCVCNYMHYFIENILERILILTSVNEKQILHLQFYLAGDWTNFLHTAAGSFWFTPSSFSITHKASAPGTAGHISAAM